MSEQHTQTPWTVSVYGNVERDHAAIRVLGFSLTGGSEATANTRRIVACVNACEGMRNDELEGGLLLGIMDAKIERLEQQRDELIAALKVADKWLAIEGYTERGDARKQVLSAIAKAEQ